MKIKIESTATIIHLNGIAVRKWVGKTETGVDISCFISRICVDKKQDLKQFRAELKEMNPPIVDETEHELRLIL